MNKTGALQNIKVLDMGQVQAGPMCSAILGDMGADVVKLEAKTGDIARGSLPAGGYFAVFNRSKRGITLDLKKGKDVFLKIVEEVDVIVENFRPGVMKRLGLDYEELKKINPKLIYAAISGFGQVGPYSQRGGLDPIAQGMSGIVSVTGSPGRPPVRCGAAICDAMAGMNAAIGILAALNYRNLTGEGQMIDVALVDVGVAALSSVNQVYLSTGVVPTRLGNEVMASAPGGCYKTSDGEVLLYPYWKPLCEQMGRQDLFEDPKYATLSDRDKNREELNGIIEEWTKTKTVDEVVTMFADKQGAVGPIFNLEQVVNDPHIAGVRNMFTEVNLEGFGKVKITNQNIKMSGTPPSVSDPPGLGQHNDEFYKSLGYTEDQIKEMEEKGII